jgi:hypothetical protein
MIRRTLAYATLVWLSAVALGPVLLYFALASMPSGPDWIGFDRVDFFFMGWLAGLFYSFPSAVVLWVVAFFICKREMAPVVKRIWMAVAAIPMVFLPLLVFARVVFRDLEAPVMIDGCYYLLIVAGIFIYRLPVREEGSPV